MKKLTPKAAYRKLASIYDRMVDQYSDAAEAIGMTCNGCHDNCCLSFFQHHTYVEWAYMWEGLNQLPAERLEEIREKARIYVESAQDSLNRGERPHLMCPLNIDEQQGICGLYNHRLMICRMHGVPNLLVKPNGQQVQFPGCYRCQELTDLYEADGRSAPVVNRTSLYKDLVMLEMQFVGKNLRQFPKVDHTIAEMIVLGPPRFR
ncbi:hypothetical protein [Pseudodesulfovibrio piezophilus]|uniref:YkgJ family cysteine cluster protein n=1 Tax=Pseudodesulfovibrio piezophilus (strain DSM 21447 / JCM 15486 / C1TLV30) TaxID=1322246 RepID=M1WKQ7_PSEP2|nr:hypothetical protein [Pseudodesulfovibrio piezophilus]CCH50021.1 conserved protein of unknown function [Pseudodesulfovibrio piezophilus C1TLV30]